MPHHYRRTSILLTSVIEVRIDRLHEEAGNSVEGSTVVLSVPVEGVFAHGAKATHGDVGALVDVLLKKLEELSLNKDPGEQA